LGYQLKKLLSAANDSAVQVLGDDEVLKQIAVEMLIK